MKPRMVEVTEPREVASVRKNELHDIIGGFVDGRCFAYAWSVERWRLSRSSKEGP